MIRMPVTSSLTGNMDGCPHLILCVLLIVVKGVVCEEAAVSAIVSATDCSNASSLNSSYQQCVDIYNIDIPPPAQLTGADPQSTVLLIDNLLVDHSHTVCSNQENYTRLSICWYEVSKECNNAHNSQIYPQQTDLTAQLHSACISLSNITSEANQGVDIVAQAGCMLGTQASALSPHIQRCMSENGVSLQLTQTDAELIAAADSSAPLIIHLMNRLRADPVTICSEQDPYIRVVNCMHYLLFKCGVGAAMLTSMPTQVDLGVNFNQTCLLIDQLTNVDSQVQAITETLDCSQQAAVMAAQQQCFDMYGIAITSPQTIAAISVMSLVAIQTLVITYPTIICSEQASYRQTLGCLYHIIFTCDTSYTISIESFYNLDSSLTLQVTCPALTQPGLQCLRTKESALLQCESQLGSGLDNNCGAEERERSCKYPIVTECGQESLDLFDSAFRLSCRNTPDTSTVLPAGHDHTFDCSTVKGRNDGFMDCLLYNGLYHDLESVDTLENAIREILRFVTVIDVEKMCRNTSPYLAAVKCVLDVHIACRTQSELNIVPEYGGVETGITTLCQSTHKFGRECIVNTDQTPCANITSQNSDSLCSVSTSYRACMVGAVESCDQNTISLYKYLLDTQAPAPCLQQGGVPKPTLENSVSFPTTSVSTLISCLCCVFVSRTFLSWFNHG